MAELERVEHPNGVVTVRSRLLHGLGVPHGFTTRLGGVSVAPFDTLNLAGVSSLGGADDPGHRAENHLRALAALECDDHALVSLHLVHGDRVLECRSTWPVDAPMGDAVMTRERGRLLKVTTADCVGVLLASPATGAVAAVHAGWRGVVAGVAGRTVAALSRSFAAAPGDLVAAIGPCIGRRAFEVGDEVVAALAGIGLGGHVARPAPGSRAHVDLFGCMAAQLVAAGMLPQRIDGTPLCTVENPQLFFSHRRDHGATGRMAALIAPP